MRKSLSIHRKIIFAVSEFKFSEARPPIVFGNVFGVQKAWIAQSCRQKQNNPTFAVEAWKVLSKL